MLKLLFKRFLKITSISVLSARRFPLKNLNLPIELYAVFTTVFLQLPSRKTELSKAKVDKLNVCWVVSAKYDSYQSKIWVNIKLKSNIILDYPVLGWFNWRFLCCRNNKSKYKRTLAFNLLQWEDIFTILKCALWDKSE